MLLQSFEGLSDAEACDRLEVDLRWQAAAGVACGYLILSTTFQSRSSVSAASVSMWGFRGPLGAFICAWGGVAMITSAPFDNWWHAAYGLDVKIISPPHILRGHGSTAIVPTIEPFSRNDIPDRRISCATGAFSSTITRNS